jgi:PRTRC genetic system protein B
MTELRNELLLSSFNPALSIIVYEDKSNTGDRKYYLESHEINDKGQVMAGRPLMQETIQGIVDTFFDENQNRSKVGGLMPDNLLSFSAQPGGYYDMTWYRPAEKRFIHFAKQLKLKSGEAWVPPIIYHVSRKSLAVYALKSNQRPVEATNLLRAPFHNVNDDGAVCLGNAQVFKPKEKTFTAYMKYWEDLFWLSEFSHLNGAGNPTKSSLSKVWTRMVNSKCKLKWSAIDELQATKGYTLKKLIK